MQRRNLLNIDNILNIVDDDKESLANRVKQLFEIIEYCYDGIYITDGEANTIMVNQSYEKITGLKREQMLGKNMKLIEKNGYISKSATLMVIKSKKSITIEQKFKTGKKVLVSSNPVFNNKDEITMVVTNVRDITELYELKQQLEKNKEITDNYHLQVEAMRKQLTSFPDIVAIDEGMLKLLKMAKKVAEVDATVLLLGETGVGKEVIAKYIHKNSIRSSKSFIKINCGAIPPSLIETELFGYEKGAFTGASNGGKIGLFELADKGTVFLDEISELPYNVQVKLLTVLQENEITRVGSTKVIKIDVRVIAATNRDLNAMVQNKIFREDLFYRLNVIPLTILPLRERKDDIEPLALNFLRKGNKKYNFNKVMTSAAMELLLRYNWPGNVRELKNIMERIVIMSTGDKILRSDLPIREDFNSSKIVFDISESNIKLKETIEKIEAIIIFKTFEKYNNVRDAAKELGIDPATFVRKRKKYKNKGLYQS